jgi:hypothetical protein
VGVVAGVSARALARVAGRRVAALDCRVVLVRRGLSGRVPVMVLHASLLGRSSPTPAQPITPIRIWTPVSGSRVFPCTILRCLALRRAREETSPWQCYSTLFELIIPPTIAALKELSPALIVPAHCTGWKATHALARELPKAFVPNSVGTRFML